MGVDPRVILVLLVLGAGYVIGEEAVKGIKIADRAICHVVTFGHKCKAIIPPAPPPAPPVTP